MRKAERRGEILVIPLEYLLSGHDDMQCGHHCTKSRLQPNPRTSSTKVKAYAYSSNAASYIKNRMKDKTGEAMCITTVG
jgi:hypothetical protein